MSYFAEFLKLVTLFEKDGEQVVRNNPEKLVQNIKKLNDDFAKDNYSKLDGGKLVRIFNDLHGEYPQLEGRLEYLKEAVDADKFEIYYNDILAYSYLELFDEQGNLLPSLKDALNYDNFLNNSLENKSPEEIDKFHGFLLSSFCTNIIGTIAWNMYGVSNFTLAKSFTDRMYEDMEKALNTANIQHILVAGRVIAPEVEDANKAILSNDPAPSNEPVPEPAVITKIDQEEKELSTEDEPILVDETAAQMQIAPTGVNIYEEILISPEEQQSPQNGPAENTISTHIDENRVQSHFQSPKKVQPEQRSFAETSTGKILIASLTAMIASPILVGVAAAVGITFPFSLPIMIVLTAVFFGATAGFLAKVADWIGEKFAAGKQRNNQPEATLGNKHLPETENSYVNIGQSLNQGPANKVASENKSNVPDEDLDDLDLFEKVPTKTPFEAFHRSDAQLEDQEVESHETKRTLVTQKS